MEKKSTDLQHVVFETEEAGRVEAMWSSLRLNGQDVPDGWHRYAVRGGDDGWEPCSIEPFVWVNHTADIITPVDLELDKHDRMLTIRDCAFFSRGLFISRAPSVQTHRRFHDGRLA